MTSTGIINRYYSLWVPTTLHEDYEEGGLGVRIGSYSKYTPLPLIAGYFYINQPFSREELLNDLKEIYGDAFEIRTIDKKGININALVCRMSIKRNTLEYLVPLEFRDGNDETKQHLDELAKNPPLPHLKIWFDERFGYYKAKIAKEELS